MLICVSPAFLYITIQQPLHFGCRNCPRLFVVSAGEKNLLHASKFFLCTETVLVHVRKKTIDYGKHVVVIAKPHIRRDIALDKILKKGYILFSTNQFVQRDLVKICKKYQFFNCWYAFAAFPFGDSLSRNLTLFSHTSSGGV